MDRLRIDRHPITGEDFDTVAEVTIHVDGRPLTVREGESLAAALWAAGISALRRDDFTAADCGLYCGIGHCQGCRVTVDGYENVRSCLTPVREGMRVSLSATGWEEGEECG